MKRIQRFIVALSLALLSSVPLSGQHFVPVYQSLYQPMNIIVNGATITGVDLEAGDEIGIFDTDISGTEICVGSIVLTGPITVGNPLPIVASTDDPLTTEQDGFIVGNTILYRFWDNSLSIELICITPSYETSFDEVFTSLGTALCGLEGIYSPTADAGADDESCSDTPYTLSGSATNQESILWVTSGDGTFDDATSLTATYTPGSSDIGSGIATLTLNAYAVSPCGDDASDFMVLLVQGAPTADAGADDDICEDASYTLSGIATNHDAVLWTSSGDGTFDDATLLNATYTPGSGDISGGGATLSLTATAILPCGTDAVDDMVLSIQTLPTANAGANANICENVSYTLSGSATDYASILWTSDGDGSFDDATLLNATYTPGTDDISTGVAILTLTASAMSPCGVDASDDMVLTVQNLPFASAGPDETICEGQTHTLVASASNYSTLSWTTAGDGTFDNASILNATYTPGTEDLSNGSVDLTLTASAVSPCGTGMIDVMTLSFEYLPSTPATPSGPTDVDIHITPTSIYEVVPTTPGAITYDWTLSPLAAGNLVSSGVTATVTWNAAYHGFAYVKVYAVNACGSMVSDSLEINVYNTVGVPGHENSGLSVNIMPNPNNGHFRVNIEGVESELNLALFGSDGSLIETRLINNTGTNNMEFSLEDLPNGLYFIRIYNEKINLLNKVIIQ